MQLKHRLAGPWGHSKASIRWTQNGSGGAFVHLRHRLARHLFAGAGSLGSLKSDIMSAQNKCGGAFVQLRHRLANALRAEG